MWPIIHMELWDQGSNRIEGTWDWVEEERKGDIPVFYLRHLLHKPGEGGVLTPAVHEPLTVIARRDKFSPIMCQKLVTGEPLSEVVLKWFRVNHYAQEEHFYTHILENVFVVGIDIDMDLDFYHFMYKSVNCRHELAATEFEAGNALIAARLRASKGKQLKSFQEYEAEQKRKDARKEKRKKANERIKAENNPATQKPEESPGSSNNEDSRIGDSSERSDAAKHMARGRVSEKRVLSDIGMEKNTSKVSTSEGNSIPDALNEKVSVEIKDVKTVSNTKQVRIQTESAKRSNPRRKSILITGQNTHVTKSAEDSFDMIIRRKDLGPQND